MSSDALLRVESELNKIILGQSAMIRQFLAGVLAGGHILLEGLPGLGKTQMVRAFSRLCGLTSNRIQFTPDLMPMDITGSNLLRSDKGEFEFHEGPLFANLVIADEINRASPKTQSALLEAMQERQVTVLGKTHRLPIPFAVLATQNPIELEGTYPLPEAQLDRFLFKIHVGEVSEDILQALAVGNAGGELPEIASVMTGQEFQESQGTVKSIPIAVPVGAYIARLIASARPSNAKGLATYIKYGASPRAVLGLAAASKALAFLDGRISVGFEDVKAAAPPILRHRIILDYHARIENIDTDKVIAELLEKTPVLERNEPQSLASKLASGE
jgi:MoxR-like ATPase